MNERDKELAIEAGFDGRREWPPMYKKFADLVRADEREACALIVEDMNSLMSPEIAKAIRAKGNT